MGLLSAQLVMRIRTRSTASSDWFPSGPGMSQCCDVHRKRTLPCVILMEAPLLSQIPFICPDLKGGLSTIPSLRPQLLSEF